MVPDAIERILQQQQNPLKPLDPPEWANMTAQEQFTRAFLTLRHAFGPSAAFNMWQHMDEQMAATPTDGLRALQEAFSLAWKEAQMSPVGAKARTAAKKTADVVSEAHPTVYVIGITLLQSCCP